MVTKKDFIKDAARIASLVAAGGNRKTLAELATLTADDHAKANPRFNRARFIAACGVGA